MFECDINVFSKILLKFIYRFIFVTFKSYALKNNLIIHYYHYIINLNIINFVRYFIR